MTHYPTTTHESASTMLDAGWDVILAALVVATLLAVLALVLISNPMLGVGVGVGLLLRPILGFGRRAGRRVSDSAVTEWVRLLPEPSLRRNAHKE